MNYLTQMESFSGIFIVAASLVHDLDQTPLQRSDLRCDSSFYRLDNPQNCFANT